MKSKLDLSFYVVPAALGSLPGTIVTFPSRPNLQTTIREFDFDTLDQLPPLAKELAAELQQTCQIRFLYNGRKPRNWDKTLHMFNYAYLDGKMVLISGNVYIAPNVT